MKMTKAFKK